MVQLKCFSILLLLISHSTGSELVAEESKTVLTKSKDKKALAADHFQCDLELLPQQEASMYRSVRVKKSEVPQDLYKWPKDKDGFVIVPYRIAQSSQFSSDQLSIIRYAMDEIERETCIRFKPRKFAKDFVNIFAGRFCKSNLGRVGGQQELSLNKARCMQNGIVIHELLHALGYIHMHSRPNRDKYVKILWQNIDPRFFREFDRVSPQFFNYYGTAYDYNSIMHYGSKAGTKNGGLTIVPKDESYLGAIGQRSGLSAGDIQRINNKYHCRVDKPSFNFYPSYETNGFTPIKYDTNGFAPKISSYSAFKHHDDDDDLFNLKF